MISGWEHVQIGEWNGCCESPSWAAGWDVTCSRRLTLPVDVQAARLARRATCEALRSWDLMHLQETAVLLVSELVTNAVRHARAGGPMMTLRLEASRTTLCIEVEDADPRWPQPRRPAGLDDCGFGFVLVEGLARSWGLRATAMGKAVWAELDI